MAWYSVRSILLFGTKQNGAINVYEERIVLFKARNADEAFQKAEKESSDYTENQDFIIHPDMQLYLLESADLIDGIEVWSQLFETNEDLQTFFKNRYDLYKFNELPE